MGISEAHVCGHVFLACMFVWMQVYIYVCEHADQRSAFGVLPYYPPPKLWRWLLSLSTELTNPARLDAQ